LWSSWVKIKDITQVGPKRAAKFSQMILERVFEMVWWRTRKWTHVKDFEVEIFFSSQNINFLFLFAETLGAILFSFLSFFQYFFCLSFFSMLHLFEDLGI
jgi:hypothetical protein